MPAYKINIDGRVYEGHYANKPNAVFGAMLKDDIDRRRVACALPLTPHSRACTCISGQGYHCNCGALNRNMREAAQVVGARTSSLIGIEEIKGRDVAKKVHRTNA